MQNNSDGTNYPIEFMRVAGVILITFTHMRHEFTEGTTYFVLETLPRYGTLLLSVISGYLFCMNPSGNIFRKKISSLLVPYLIANLAVLLPVLLIYACGYNYLNRLPYDHTLISEGLLSLNSPPINPPTYFIRDLFVIFCFLGLLQKNYWGLLFIVPLFFFGQIVLRWDIPMLFAIGFTIAKFRIEKQNRWLINGIGSLALIATIFFFTEETYKYIIALLFFLNFVTLKFKFVKTGAYTYLLHLYHTPIMIALFPILHRLYPNPYFEILAQVSLAIGGCYILLLVVKRFNIRLIAGNRY
jgi:hypothetical protein